MPTGTDTDDVPVAYEVDRQPGEWVAQQAARRSRRVWLLLGLVGAIVLGDLGLLFAHRTTIAIGAVAAILALALLYKRQVDEAVFWLRGARAERSVGEELNELRREGFILMHDVEQAGEGNIDHIVSGPTGVYMVETKARRYEEGHLVKAKRQAAKLHDELGVWVTPVICIHLRSGEPFRARGVWIVPQPALLEWIREQRNTPVPFERLAQYADGL